MSSMYSVGTIVRGADGVLYDVSASGGGRLAQDPSRGSCPAGAQADSPQETQSTDYAASRVVIDPGDYDSSRVVIEARDYDASRVVIDPGDYGSSRVVIEPGDHAAA